MDPYSQDVVAVSLATGKVRILAQRRTPESADAIVTMSAMRRGVDEEFFVSVPRQTYADGDTYRPSDERS